MFENLKMKPGHSSVTTIFSRPCVGKTTLSLEILAYFINIFKCPVSIFSLELYEKDIRARIARKTKQEAKIDVNDLAGIFLADYLAGITKFVSENQNCLILVDYFQLINIELQHPKSMIDRDIEAQCEIIKKFLKKMNVPIIINSQIPRQVVFPTPDKEIKPIFKNLLVKELIPLIELSDEILILNRPNDPDTNTMARVLEVEHLLHDGTKLGHYLFKLETENLLDISFRFLRNTDS